MRRTLLLGLVLLICLTSAGARHQITTVYNETIWISQDIPDTELYVLDEEANKDKLFCKTKTDAEGKITRTDWYNYCSGEFVKSETADTCTNAFRYPEYECVFAKGSNADKVYCRGVKGPEGTIVETRWFNYCSGNLVKTEEGDTCTKEFKNPVYKCYKEEVVEEQEEILVEEEEVVEEEVPEEEPTEIPPEETQETQPEITPTEAKSYTWIAIVAVLVIIGVAVVMFLKMKKKKEAKKEIKGKK